MITLPQEKRWTGDSFGDNYARLFKQLKRNDKVALYARVVEDSGTIEGYEVFHIKMRLKGQALPGGLFEEEDREVYPSAGSFGKSAWQIDNLIRAEQRFDELTQQEIDKTANEDEAENSSVSPGLLFSTQEYADKNNIAYPIAYLTIKAAVESGKMKFIKSERRNAKGKETKLFAMV
jgi:hypothetical protein